VVKTIGQVGFDDTIVDIRMLEPFKVKNERGQIVPNAFVVTVHFVDTNQYKKYVTIANSLTDIPNPLFFTGIDEREWNCYVQGLVPTRLMLDGKPIC
jgi:hypothetical protein